MEVAISGIGVVNLKDEKANCRNRDATADLNKAILKPKIAASKIQAAVLNPGMALLKEKTAIPKTEIAFKKVQIPMIF